MRYLYLTLFTLLAGISPHVTGAQEAPSSREKIAYPHGVAEKKLQTPQVYEYYVLRNNKQIGSYRFKVTEETRKKKAPSSPNKTQKPLLRIETEMDVKVKLFFYTAYEAAYQAASIYDGAELLRYEGMANINGKEYIVNYNRAQNEDHIVVNAQGKKLSGSPVTLNPFYMKTLESPNGSLNEGESEGDKKADSLLNFITEKGKIRNIHYKTKGKERIEINAKKLKATHARIVGDITRDLWYDKDGTLLKVAYQKDGATITLVRKDI